MFSFFSCCKYYKLSETYVNRRSVELSAENNILENDELALDIKAAIGRAGNTRIIKLDLSNKAIYEFGGYQTDGGYTQKQADHLAQALAEQITQFPYLYHLQELHLKGCLLNDNNARQIVNALISKKGFFTFLKKINLSENNLTEATQRELATALKTINNDMEITTQYNKYTAAANR